MEVVSGEEAVEEVVLEEVRVEAHRQVEGEGPAVEAERPVCRLVEPVEAVVVAGSEEAPARPEGEQVRVEECVEVAAEVDQLCVESLVTWVMCGNTIDSQADLVWLRKGQEN